MENFGYKNGSQVPALPLFLRACFKWLTAGGFPSTPCPEGNNAPLCSMNPATSCAEHTKKTWFHVPFFLELAITGATALWKRASLAAPRPSPCALDDGRWLLGDNWARRILIPLLTYPISSQMFDSRPSKNTKQGFAVYLQAIIAQIPS